MVVLEGRIEFRTDDADAPPLVGEAGATVFLPCGVAHSFQVTSPTARFVALTAGRTGRPLFTDFVAAMGTPADRPEMPEPVAIDPGEVARVRAAHGIEVLGPPPAPLDSSDLATRLASLCRLGRRLGGRSLIRTSGSAWLRIPQRSRPGTSGGDRRRGRSADRELARHALHTVDEGRRQPVRFAGDLEVGELAEISSNIIWISRRARLAPRQKCGPPAP